MSVKERYRHLPRLPREAVARLYLLEQLFSEHSVRLAYLFGSLAHASDPDEAEDIDLAVLPDEGFSWMKLYAKLSEQLTTERLDLVDLSVAPLTLQFEVVTTGRCLFARSAEDREHYEQRVRMKLRDELPRIRLRTEALREWVNG